MRWGVTLILVTLGSPGNALEPAEIFVVANRNMKSSCDVAEHYMVVRGVPRDHLILLDLPDREDISRSDYDAKLATPLREALKKHKSQAKLILTVYGVPLRVGGQVPSAAEKAALAQLFPELEAARQKEAALGPDQKANPQQRTALRRTVNQLEQRRKTLSHSESHAAVDSELMLLWWENYPLDRWVSNPLNWQVPPQTRRGKPPVLMTARLDGPTATIARRLVDDAVAVESTGLEGIAVIDTRADRFDPFQDSIYGYGAYDQSMRETARLLERTGMSVRLDEKSAVLPPGSAQRVALYCGWYSHANFVDCCEYQRGAVAWHLASSEAVTLRKPDSKVWCPNLLKKGVAVTLGPVAEPYTIGFPKPAEFFGFLVTGQFTLAECYARTVNQCSWMTVLVGDPLYNPYRKHPRLQPADILFSPRSWRTFGLKR